MLPADNQSKCWYYGRWWPYTGISLCPSTIRTNYFYIFFFGERPSFTGTQHIAHWVGCCRFFSHSLSQERLSIFPRVHLLFFFSSFFFAQCVDKYSRYIYNSSSNVLKPAISNSMPSVRLNTFSKWCSLYKCIHSISDQRKQHYLFSLHTYFLQLDFISFSPSTKNHFMC